MGTSRSVRCVAIALTTVLTVTALSTDSDAAAGERVQVEGDRFGTTLQQRIVSCDNPAGTATVGFDFRAMADPQAPLGTHAVRWIPTAEDAAMGPVARVPDPGSLSALSIMAKGPIDGDAGVAFAEFRPTGDPGAWLGVATLRDLPVDFGWFRVDAAGVEYEWKHVTDGVVDATASDETLQTFVAQHGGNGQGALVGLGFGCKGTATPVDAFRVSSASTDVVYDFEGYATRSDVRLGKSKRTTTRITYGQQVRLRTTLRAAVGSTTIGGTTALLARNRGTSRSGTVATVRLGPSGQAWTSYRPRRSVALRTQYAGTGEYEGSTSREVTVIVRTAVRARVNDRTVRQGERLTFVGRRLPRRKGQVLLQRRQGRTWVTVSGARTRPNGRFRITARSTEVGRTSWRVVVPAAGGLATGRTRPVRVVTTRRAAPAPAPSSGSGTGPSTGSGSGTGSGSSGGGSPPPPPPPPGGFKPTT